MAGRKRKSDATAASTTASPNKRLRGTEPPAPSSRPRRNATVSTNVSRSTRSSSNAKATTVKNDTKKTAKPAKAASDRVNNTKGKESVHTSPAKIRKSRKEVVNAKSDETESTAMQQNISVDIPGSKRSSVNTKAAHDQELEDTHDGPSYWLMKAEPESRLEKGKDVKFSIDDLKAATAPEGWDGVRNAVARNNMRLMMKGDMAFFYHSNCKVPGIAGTMEVVQEHSVDETAFDPQHPYYDVKSDRNKPKWCLVHVEFRQKFPGLIKLKELQKYAQDGGVLEHLQTLKQSRLSVSKVTKTEWDFIMSLVDEEGS